MSWPTEQVAVDGGVLTVHALGDAPPGAPTVVALHSIASNALSWAPVASTLAGRVRVLAPDMRGRAESAALRSTGLADHAADIARVIEHFGLERPVLAGHAMGAFAAALAAATYPDQVGSVVLVDGGLALPSPDTFDVDVVLHGIIGPALDRLSMVFADEQAYLDHWHQHPALGPHLAGPAAASLTAYLLHDLAGPPGQLRSTTSLECVRADWSDLMTDPATLSAIHTLQCAAHLLWAERGPLGQAEGLYTADRLAAAHLPADVTLTRLEADHYGTLLDPHCVRAVADAVAGAVADSVAGAVDQSVSGPLVSGPISGRSIHTSIK